MDAEHYPFCESVNPYMLPDYERTTIKLAESTRAGVAKIDDAGADLATAIPQVLAKPLAIFETDDGNWVFFGTPGPYWVVDARTETRAELLFPSSMQLAVYVDGDLWVVRWLKVLPVVSDRGVQLRDYPGLGKRLLPP